MPVRKTEESIEKLGETLLLEMLIVIVSSKRLPVYFYSFGGNVRWRLDNEEKYSVS